jgi:NAD(P)-dependent dehydrogenase (short-subunit alcohol dehydrogenase family)
LTSGGRPGIIGSKEGLMSRFDGKVAVVTGAGGGIGEAYAKGLAAEGARVVIAEINAAAGERVAKEIESSGGRAIAIETDIGDEASTLAMGKAAREAYGGVDYLINNAAIFGNMESHPLLEVDVDYWNRFMAVNVTGTLLATRAVADSMIERGGGAIVNQSSTAAWMGAGYYSICKLSINGLTQALARELGPHGIRVNGIAPGPTETEALRKSAPQEIVDALVASMPLSRLGQPDDMVGPVLFLLSEEAKWVTGMILNVDGGQLMRA